MPKRPEHEYGARARMLRIMMAILERPNAYTKKDLAQRYGFSVDTIKGDFECFENAGLLLEHDSKYRYAFQVTQPYKQLKHLLHFTEEDQYILENAIDNIEPHSPQAKKLKDKLSALYDYHLLGHAYLRKPYLDKVDNLLQAQGEKLQVILVDYPSSNSNQTKDRQVEPFHTSPPDDILHAFDISRKKVRHFRISRIKRVKLLNTPWAYEGHHVIMYTDPFRISSNEQVPVHLKLSVGARNELIERFPMAKRHIEEAAEEDRYDFQCEVNAQFLGITNFILGSYLQGVEVISPDSLKEHLREVMKRMEF